MTRPQGCEGEARAAGPRYHRFAPRAELAPWLARLWVQEAPAAAAPPTTVLPIGQVELIVRHGDPFVHLEAAAAITVPPVAVLGQRTRPIRAAATGVTGLVIAGLHPWAAEALLGDAACGLADRAVDLAELLGRPRVASLQERVAEAGRPEQRARLVESFLARLFREAPDALAVACARQIARSGGRLSVAALARELGASERHLRRRFARAAGIGPKRLARIVRAQRALAGLRAGVASSELAARCGYVDQAHLTRELKAFTGRTPGSLRPGGETPLMRSFNGVARARSDTVYI